jgi:hypothetical protein
VFRLANTQAWRRRKTYDRKDAGGCVEGGNRQGPGGWEGEGGREVRREGRLKMKRGRPMAEKEKKRARRVMRREGTRESWAL